MPNVVWVWTRVVLRPGWHTMNRFTFTNENMIVVRGRGIDVQVSHRRGSGVYETIPDGSASVFSSFNAEGEVLFFRGPVSGVVEIRRQLQA